MSLLTSWRALGSLGSFGSSSSVASKSYTTSPLFFPQQNNVPVFNEEYDSFVRICEVLIHFESGKREHFCFTRSSWAIIFNFGGRNIKYELVNRTGGTIGPIWIDLGRNKPASIVRQVIKVTNKK